MWITRGMFVPHIPPVTHTNPPPAHTTPGKVQGYSDSFSITGFFQKTRWETRIDPLSCVADVLNHPIRGGSFALEWVATLAWIRWQPSSGIRRHQGYRVFQTKDQAVIATG